jgi:hypothetical protein
VYEVLGVSISSPLLTGISIQTAVCTGRFESFYGKQVFHMAAEERDPEYTISDTPSLFTRLANGQRQARIYMSASQF